MHGAILKEHPEAYPRNADFRIDAVEPARPDHLAGANRAARAAGRVGARLRHRLLERREPDPRAIGAPRRGARDPRRARRERRRAAPHAARREPAALRRRRDAGRAHRAADGGGARALRVALLGARARPHRRCHACSGSASASRWPPRCCSRSCRGCRRRTRRAGSACRAAACGSRPARTAACALFAVTQIAASFVLLAGAGMLLTTLFALQRRSTGFNTRNVLALNVPVVSFARPPEQVAVVLPGGDAPHQPAAGRRARGGRHDRAVARCRRLRSGLPVLGRGLREGERRRGSARAVPHRSRRDSSRALGVPIIAGRDFTDARPARRRERWSSSARASRSRMFPAQDAVNRKLMWTDPGHEVHRRQHRARGASSASSPTSTTRTSCRGRR